MVESRIHQKSALMAGRLIPVVLAAVLVIGLQATPAAANVISGTTGLENARVLTLADGRQVDCFWMDGILYLELRYDDPEYLAQVRDLMLWLESMGIEVRIWRYGNRSKLHAYDYYGPYYYGDYWAAAGWWWGWYPGYPGYPPIKPPKPPVDPNPPLMPEIPGRDLSPEQMAAAGQRMLMAETVRLIGGRSSGSSFGGSSGFSSGGGGVSASSSGSSGSSGGGLSSNSGGKR